MDLFDALRVEHRQRLEQAAVILRLRPGELLLRRGEQGGDLYRLESGTLEVIDAQREPPLVLAVMGHGALVGEMAFLDGSIRSADVRAAEACECQHWRRQDLLDILEGEPALGLSFFRALADLVNARSRNVRSLALDDRSGASAGGDTLRDDVHQVATTLQRRLLAAEPVLRTQPDVGRIETLQALDQFHRGLVDLAERMSAEEQREGFGGLQSVRPFLIRSHFGELAMAPPSGHTDDLDVATHLAAGVPGGDGELGVLIDEWLLSLPTSVGMRSRTTAALAAVRGAPRGTVVLVNAVGSGLAAAVVASTQAPHRSITIAEDREETLRRVGTHEGVRLRHVPLAEAALGERELVLPPPACIVLDGVLDALPDRVAATLLRAARQRCPTGATLVVTATGPATDEVFFHRVLGWPLVRRTRSALAGLLTRTGFEEVQPVACDGAAHVLRASAGLDPEPTVA